MVLVSKQETNEPNVRGVEDRKLKLKELNSKTIGYLLSFKSTAEVDLTQAVAFSVSYMTTLPSPVSYPEYLLNGSSSVSISSPIFTAPLLNLDPKGYIKVSSQLSDVILVVV